jgi:hypothetical protein
VRRNRIGAARSTKTIAVHPILVNVTRPVNVEFGSDEQSTPEKSASIVLVSALPTLSNVPVHPRGDG